MNVMENKIIDINQTKEIDGIVYDLSSNPFTGIVRTTNSCISTYNNVEISYVDGIKHGLYYEYYENGNIQYKSLYKDGLAHGQCTVYNPDGILVRDCYFKDDELHGSCKYFNLDGVLIYDDTYVNGELQ